MSIRPQYHVQKLSEGFTTFETVYSMEKGKDGTLHMEPKKVPSTGGFLIRNPRTGDEIRLATKDQLDHFGLTERPKLINEQTGEEVNEQGVPLSLVNYVSQAGQVARIDNPVDTDTRITAGLDDIEKE